MSPLLTDQHGSQVMSSDVQDFLATHSMDDIMALRATAKVSRDKQAPSNSSNGQPVQPGKRLTRSCLVPQEDAKSKSKKGKSKKKPSSAEETSQVRRTTCRGPRHVPSPRYVNIQLQFVNLVSVEKMR